MHAPSRACGQRRGIATLAALAHDDGVKDIYLRLLSMRYEVKQGGL